MGFFSDSVRATAEKMIAQIDTAVESIAVDLFTTVVELSPAKPNAKTAKGEFINNWNAGSNSEVQSHTDSRSMTGDASKASILAARGHMTFLRRDGYMTLTNTTPYGKNIEYDGWPAPTWTGTIGPYAPVRKAFIKVAPKYKK